MSKRLDPRPSSPPSLESLREPLARGLDRIAWDYQKLAASLVRSPGSWLARAPLAVLCVAVSAAASFQAERIRAGAVAHPAHPAGKTPPA
jgi:hypothetical protein